MDSGGFQSLTHDNLHIKALVDKIKAFILEEPDAKYALTIGSDSEIRNETSNSRFLGLVTAIVIYRKGNGGRYFWKKKKIATPHTLREKIYEEVLMSLDVAHKLVPELREQLQGTNANYDLEIHIDVGEKGATREMIREVVGMVTGSGFVARTKPFSYAASNIADRHT